MSRKPKTETEPAATVEKARAELQAAEQELAALDIHRGDLSEVATRRRELRERIEIARERLALAEQRTAEIEFSEAERRIDELQKQQAAIDAELQAAREQAAADLREHLNGDWLAGSGRFASQPPALPGLLGYCNSVSEVEGRRDTVQAAIRSLERRVAERRAQLDREAATARTDARRKLIGGDTVSLDLVPWKIEAHTGFVQDLADSMTRKHIPMAMADPSGRTVHALLPSGSQPGTWADGNHMEAAEQIEPADLCPAMAAVWQRAAPSKKRASR